MNLVKRIYQNVVYSISLIDTIEQLQESVKNNVDIIQFSILEKDYDLHKINPPKGYMYLSARHIPFGGTAEYDNIPKVENEISIKFCVCFYKAELHGKVNEILNNSVIYY